MIGGGGRISLVGWQLEMVTELTTCNDEKKEQLRNKSAKDDPLWLASYFFFIIFFIFISVGDLSPPKLLGAQSSCRGNSAVM